MEQSPDEVAFKITLLRNQRAKGTLEVAKASCEEDLLRSANKADNCTHEEGGRKGARDEGTEGRRAGGLQGGSEGKGEVGRQSGWVEVREEAGWVGGGVWR